MAKQIINVEVERNIKYELEGTLQSVVNNLTQLLEKHGPTATLSIDEEWEYGEKYICASVSVTRRETDEEEARREAALRSARERQEARDKEQWEKLNAKYGKKEE